MENCHMTKSGRPCGRWGAKMQLGKSLHPPKSGRPRGATRQNPADPAEKCDKIRQTLRGTVFDTPRNY